VQTTTKEPLAGAAALSVLEGVTELFVAKGKNVLHFDLQAEPLTDDELLDLLLGRSGKLRAPAIRTGSRLLVGYNPEILATNLL
jgi:arsenate reductase-like glutaredoxin family protein